MAHVRILVLTSSRAGMPSMARSQHGLGDSRRDQQVRRSKPASVVLVSQHSCESSAAKVEQSLSSCSLYCLHASVACSLRISCLRSVKCRCMHATAGSSLAPTGQPTSPGAPHGSPQRALCGPACDQVLLAWQALPGLTCLW